MPHLEQRLWQTALNQSMAEGLAVGDVIISDRLAYGDVDVTEFGYTYGQVPRMPAFYQGDAVLLKKAETIYREYFATSENKYGLVVTNDSFIMRPDQHKLLINLIFLS
ncbi:5'-methylthioadenosine/S-adenosylhomocysteine nucleosidase [Listeria monocytogenes]|nr:5'-methylthioadenosine/S-adenosylhomocysteine nucleosidase [Listeria monocytogenes]